jgi:SAM-dependent methyltransferase
MMVEERPTLTSTLAQLAALDRYNGWIYEQIASAMGRRILEVGAGTGNITRFLLGGEGSDRTVVATDPIPEYRQQLTSLFAQDQRLIVDTFDLNQPAPPAFKESPFETVVCLNVLEHIERDADALREMRRVLLPGGRLALLVPAHAFIHGAFDDAVGHYRRYGKRQLGKLLEAAGFIVDRLHFFNMLAVLPWWVNGRLLRRDYLPAGQTHLADRLVPLLRHERLIGPPFGLSLIALATSPRRQGEFEERS